MRYYILALQNKLCVLKVAPAGFSVRQPYRQTEFSPQYRNLGPAESRAAHRKVCSGTVQHIKHLTNIHVPAGLIHRTDSRGCLIKQNLKSRLESAYHLVKPSSFLVLN